MNARAYLAITMHIDDAHRPAAAGIYAKYRQPFLEGIEGALSKELLIRAEDVQVLHGFDSAQHARAYLDSALFTQDVVTGLQPLWSAPPDVRVYEVA